MKADTEAAVDQRAAAGRTAEDHALEALRHDWGGAYEIGHDDERGYWARRLDGLGGDITAGTPGDLAAAMTGDCDLKPVLWCADCGKLVTATAGKAVHAARGNPLGYPDGHRAAPVDREPELWRAARRIAADYGGMFTLTARFGILRADWQPGKTLSPGTPAHYTAPGEAAMRYQLNAAVMRNRFTR